MTRASLAKIAFGIALGAIQLACGQASAPLAIAAVTPERAFTDIPQILRIDAGTTRPPLRVDVASGGLTEDLAAMKATLWPEDAADLAPARLELLEWDGVDFSLWARTPAGLAAARYTLELVDQHGQVSRLPGAFEGLGPDPAPPTIEVPFYATAPYVPAGTTAKVEIVADDGLGGVATIHWMTSDGFSGDCPPVTGTNESKGIGYRPPSRLTCVAAFDPPVLETTDPSTAPFTLSVTADDMSGLQAALELEMFRAKIPQVDSFVGGIGGLGGYQPFFVRGRFFIPGSQALIGGIPILGNSPGGDRLDDRDDLITGWTPPRNRAESVMVEVRSPAGSGFAGSLFTYIAPPRLRDVQPPVGPARGGIRVTVRGNDLRKDAVVYVGATRETRQPLYNVIHEPQNNKVVGCLPPGTGTASVWAFDATTGDGTLPMAFTYQEGGPLPPVDPACQVPLP